MLETRKRMQKGEKLSYTDKEVELIMLGWQSELQKAVAAGREACAKLAEGQTYLSRASLSSILGDDAVASCYVASAIRARGTQ